jgi:hypothetical protein
MYEYTSQDFLFNEININTPVTVAARSKACTVFARSDAGIVGSNPTYGMMLGVCMRLFCVYVVLCLGRRLKTS